jgi:hypothetical protein
VRPSSAGGNPAALGSGNGRAVSGSPARPCSKTTDPMTASYLETDAYRIGNRFDPVHAR